MTAKTTTISAARNIALYPWFRFFKNLTFWQAIWFLYFQDTLSAADAIMLYAIYDIGAITLEVPSGYMSDRLGRRMTLIISAIAGLTGAALLALGGSFAMFACAQVFLGASGAFASGTDSALLYESLNAAGRRGEIEAQELKSWRYSFVALAISAVLGGAIYLHSDVSPFYAGAAAYACTLIVAMRFKTIPRRLAHTPEGAELTHFSALKAAFKIPVLNWLLALSIVMYIIGHIPYVLSQPFILETLSDIGLSGSAPVVSGVVSATMMVISVIASLFALRLRRFLGLTAILLLAFSMQIALSAALALTAQSIAIGFLLMRMIPDAFSDPFIMARIQPLLHDESRATYISLQSFSSRIFFSGALFITALFASAGGHMPLTEIRQILGWYAIAGLVCLTGLAISAARINIDAGR